MVLSLTEEVSPTNNNGKRSRSRNSTPFSGNYSSLGVSGDTTLCNGMQRLGGVDESTITLSGVDPTCDKQEAQDAALVLLSLTNFTPPLSAAKLKKTESNQKLRISKRDEELLHSSNEALFGLGESPQLFLSVDDAVTSADCTVVDQELSCV